MIHDLTLRNVCRPFLIYVRCVHEPRHYLNKTFYLFNIWFQNCLFWTFLISTVELMNLLIQRTDIKYTSMESPCSFLKLWQHKELNAISWDMKNICTYNIEYIIVNKSYRALPLCLEIAIYVYKHTILFRSLFWLLISSLIIQNCPF